MKNKGVTKLYKTERWCYEHHLKLFAKCLKTWIRVIFGATIPYTCKIGDGTVFPHGASGVILHEECSIGEACNILPNVVIGGRKGQPGSPKIGNHCLIGAGAALLGNITIGDHVQIGANAVVLHDIPSNCTAVGVPAKIINSKENGDIT